MIRAPINPPLPGNPRVTRLADRDVCRCRRHFRGLAGEHPIAGNQPGCSVAPQAQAAGPLYASKQAHEYVEKSITRGHWVNPVASNVRGEFVSLPGKGHSGMKPSVAMANAARTPQR